MQFMLEEEDPEEVRSYHACRRRDCTRIFRDSNGYSDVIGGQIDDSRASARTCPACGAVLYLAEANRSLKVETWECPRTDCDCSEQYPSPSGR